MLKENMISQAQLDEALKTQVIFGGRLGTNLVDLGHLDEDNLAYFLSEELGVPYAHPKSLLGIDPNVIKLIPREIAERYKVLPIEVKRKKLKLVMDDPQDYEAISEIEFLTAYTIEPMVTPELRLVQALEVHYDIERSQRYIPFRDNLKEQREREAAESGVETVPVEKKIKPTLPSPPPPLAKTYDLDGPEEDDEQAETTASPEPPGVQEPAEDEVSEEVILEKVKELKKRRKEMLTRQKGKKAKKPALAKVLEENLRNVEDRNEIGKILLDYMVERFPLGAILAVKGETAYGWCASGTESCDQYVLKLRVPLVVPSILTESCENGYSIQNGKPAYPMDNLIRHILRIEKHLNLLAAPVYYNKAIVCFLLAAGPEEVFEKKTGDDVKNIADRAGEAFGRMIMRYRKAAT